MGRRDTAAADPADAADPASGFTAWARWPGLLVGLWPLALSYLLVLPLFVHAGHPLARDLVFVPREPFTDARVGLGSTAPRSVPLDAVVAVLTHLVDGGVLARLVLPLVLAVAGWGVLRLTAPLGTTARLVAAGFAVWNPYVVERMALGQWALVAAYAALPWIVVSAARFRRTADRGAAASAALWAGLASLTPTGGLLAVTAMLAAGAGRSRRTWWPGAVGVVLQLPWLLPALVGGASTTSDPAGAVAFAPGSDASGTPALALLGLGGVWDGLSVPDSRHTFLAPLTAVVVVLVLVLGWRRWWTTAGDLGPRLTGLGIAGLGLALFLATSPGQAMLRAALSDVAGTGLLRDGQKFLAPFVLLVACVLAAATDVVVRRAAGLGAEVAVPVGVLLALVPLVLLPDGAVTVWATVRPVHLPDGLARVVNTVDASPSPAGVVTLPWRSYRHFSWGNDTTASDPMVRMVDRPVFTSDALDVGDTRVRGESRVLARLGADLAVGTPARVLPGYGIGWVVLYADDPAARHVSLTGLHRVLTTPEVALYAVPGAAAVPGPATWRGVVVGVGDAIALLLLLGSAVVGVGSRRRLSTPR